MLPKCLDPQRNEHRSPPLDVRDLAVRLESEGVTDSVARGEFGYAGTWHMADAYFPNLGRMAVPDRAPSTDKTENPIVAYFRGIAFALPLLFSCLAMLALKFSLWGGEIPPDEATAIGLGTICSFIVSGGFVQAMGRRGLWFAGTGQPRMSAESATNWLCWGAMSVVAVALAGIAFNAYFDLLPHRLCALAAVFHISLGLLWLTTSMLYMLDRSLLVAAAAAAGIGAVALLHSVLHLDLLLSQVIAIGGASVFAFLVSRRLLERKSRGDAGQVRSQATGRLIYLIWPYFLYGCLYYLFLFSDRVLAWTARTEDAALLVQFRGGYEAAQDLALFAFIAQVGWVHFATADFYKHLKLHQATFTIERIADFNLAVTRFYYRRVIFFLPLVVITAAAVYGAASYLGFFRGPVHEKVAIWSLAGYFFVVVGLRNVSLLFALSRPKQVLTAIGCACCTNLVAGYLLSRFVAYDEAVIGFALGAVVFAAISSLFCVATLKRLDYFHMVAAA